MSYANAFFTLDTRVTEPPNTLDTTVDGGTEVWKAANLCGSPGCSYPDYHDGPCSHWALLDSRKRKRPKSGDDFVSWSVIGRGELCSKL